ncbi:unnamed protein product [Heligmosomoides polygyrus]|uniref:Coiled-coil domain-containing protein 149 n=1 Tax=Heligmosomoides polygyrus TaxID=6339 RepID=A0A183FAB0_HELPZ|nr:unnamed protein product [Heligmosomoides polygyrus]
MLIKSHDAFEETVKRQSEKLEHLKLAYDESYLDPTNVRSKLQKHLAFDSELSENEKRPVAVKAQEELLISKSAEPSYGLHLSDESSFHISSLDGPHPTLA